MNVFIFHGAYGSPEENWIPWLKKELESIGIEVYVPRFPTPDGQNLENWMKVFDCMEKKPDRESILIGHSVGACFMLTLLEKVKVKAGIFVSGFSEKLDNEFDEINHTFFSNGFRWDDIIRNSEIRIVYHGDDDPYVPLEIALRLEKNLNAKMHIIKAGGHLNEKAGYLTFPLLLESIINIDIKENEIGGQ